MEQRINYTGPVYRTIRDTVKITGLSDCFIRSRCKAGEINHLKSGKKYLVQVPLLLEQMAQEGERRAGDYVGE